MRKPAPSARPRSRGAPRPKVPAPTETAFHLQAAALLRLGVPAGGGFWFHVPNQGKRSPAVGQLFKGMGMLPGLSDLVLVAAVTLSNGTRAALVGFLELKAGNGKLSSDQEDFRDLCLALGVPWGEARTLAEVEDFARSFYQAAGLQFRARAS